jgi:hypothetical protein
MVTDSAEMYDWFRSHQSGAPRHIIERAARDHH